MSEEKEFCSVCNLILEHGARHLNESTCIQAQQLAMLAQRKSAEQLGLIISTRFLDVIEELCRRPEIGVPYETCFPENSADPMGKMVTQLHHSQVVGVFEAIRTLYKEMGDWSPLTAAQDELFQEQQLNIRFQSVLQEVKDLDELPSSFKPEGIPRNLKRKIEELLNPQDQG